MYKISIIIPVYNAEDTLDRSIQSILNQKWSGDFFEDIEVILVDDCSTDNSKNIIYKYLNDYNNFRFFSTEENSGYPSKPRNIGIINSNSEYLMFMDNDDEYSEDMCEVLYNTIINENADIVSCNYYKTDSISTFKVVMDFNGENIIETSDKVIFSNSDAIFFKDIFIWDKIFKKSLITDNNIYYPSKHLEDEFFSINSYIHCKKLVYLKTFWGITKHMYDDSLGNSVDLSFILDYIKGFKELYDLVDSNNNHKDYKYKFNHVKKYVKVAITKISYLNNKDDIMYSLKILHDFEKYTYFDNSLDEFSLKFINYFIIKNYLNIALLLLQIMGYMRKSKFTRYIYRLVKY